MGYFPASRDEVPMWGRIKIVRDDYAARRAKTLKGVLQYGPQAHRQVEPYGWCWAAATFLDHHPRYQKRYRQLLKFVARPDLTDRFTKLIGNDWDELAEEWQVYVTDLEYGHDLSRTVLDFTRGRPLDPSGATVTVAADRGWQNSGVWLEGGKSHQLQASGRYQVAQEPRPWLCEPNGVSIRYYRGRPLGVLLAAVRPEKAAATGPSPLISPITVGLGTTLAPKRSGTLYLRINDSAGELRDNTGTLTVRVAEAKAEGE
jgi:hypothetical protein